MTPRSKHEPNDVRIQLLVVISNTNSALVLQDLGNLLAVDSIDVAIADSECRKTHSFNFG